MSLFDEFDRLTPDAGIKKPNSPERIVGPSLGSSRLSQSALSTETPKVRPVDSIRFSLSRGAVIVIATGIFAAAALLYAGGFLTAYAVLQPADEVQAEKNHKELMPPPLVDADRPKTKGVRQKENDGTGPLKVLMSRETSGGEAIVTRQSDVLNSTRPPTATVTLSDISPPTAQASLNDPATEKSPPKPVAAPLPSAVQSEALKPLRPLAPQLSKTERKPLTAGRLIEPAVAVPLPPAPEGLPSDAPEWPSQIASSSPVVAAKQPSLANLARPVVPGSIAYTVQLGAFSSDSNAKRLLGEMSAYMPGLRVEAGKTPSGRTFYYLRAGFYANRGEAEEFAARLKSEKKIKSGYVIGVKAPSPVGGN
ncbi:SPOR domain-containing protein [Alphaproteobacteria bacterium]|jgi:hypothetical protein|nr:SPOR domain-containing protein [Alphaproteobacteria bacterium]